MAFMEFKYSKFLIEMIVIFIGITLSFWVENYRQHREDNDIEIKYLKGFLADIQLNKDEITTMKDLRNAQINSSAAMLEYFAGKKIDVDSFYHHYYTILPPLSFIPNTNTMEEVINSSHLRLISNDKIKTNLLGLRTNYDQIKTQEANLAHVQFAYLYDIGFGIVDLTGFTIFEQNGSFLKRPEFKTEAEALLKNKYQKNAYWLMNSNGQYLVSFYDSALLRGAATARLIEAELKRRNEL
jgi:hypothetical protein